MDIAGILRGFSSAAIGSQTDHAKEQSSAAASSAASESAHVSLAASAEFRDILARYDVQNISPREFSELVQKLREAGAVSEADYQELAAMRLALDEQGLESDTPLNLIDFFGERLQRSEETLARLESRQPGAGPIDRQSALADVLRQIGWVQKFALVHKAQDYQPLDAVA